MGSVSIGRRVVSAWLATLLFWGPLSQHVRAEADDEESGGRAARAAQAVARSRAGRGEALEARTQEKARKAAETSKAAAEAEKPAAEPVKAEPEQIDKDRNTVIAASAPGAAASAASSQAIALPKGEGSIEGMGESFTAQLSSGTGTFSVPIAVPPGRNGVQPALALAYATSAGDGPVGYGWSLSLPFIARQTDKGLPRYVDKSRWHAEEDTFLYNGGQELVPISSGVASAIDGAPVANAYTGWQQYRARVEGAFMRFFRAPDSSRWVVQAKDGTRFEFGRLPSFDAVEADPADSTRIFSWALVRTSDPHGASIWYQYRSQDGRLYPEAISYTEPAACAVRYAPDLVRDCSKPAEAAFQVRLVYEDRPDPSSNYVRTWRAEQKLRLKRVEVRAAESSVGARMLVRRYHLTYRAGSYHSLLEQIQVEGRPSTFDSYAEVPVGQPTSDDPGDKIIGDLLPPMVFGYSEPSGSAGPAGFGAIDATVRESAASPSHSANEARVELFDVNADGLTDVLVTDPARFDDGAGVYFNGFSERAPSTPGAFSDPVRVDVPAALSGVLNLANLNVLPMDVDGDGRSDILHMPRKANYGYFVLSKEPSLPGRNYSATDGWSFKHVTSLLPDGVTDPRIDLGQDAPTVRTLDVNNDHLIDIIRSTGSSIQTWLNLGRYPGGEGRFGSARADGAGGWTLDTDPLESCLPYAGRALDFSDGAFRIADMNGDGLADLVMLAETQTVWWPGRGPGLWGDGTRDCATGVARDREVRMGPARELNGELSGVYLMDVNADGASDLVQLSFDDMSVWFNRGGYGFSERLLVAHTPVFVEALNRVRLADIDGSGTTDIVFADAGRWRWIDPMGGVRPRLLTSVDNGLGALTKFEYSSSVVDYLRDVAAAGSCDPGELDCFTWQREPAQPGASYGQCDAFVQSKGGGCAHRGMGSPVVSTVVRRIASSDRLDSLGAAATVSATEYRYHDGYYEGIEQEFRGFGAADAVVQGDAYEPSSISRTYFHQGKRPNDIAADRNADNPNEALKGREFLSEVFDARGVYLSTTHSTYAVRKLLEGENGRDVSYAYVSSSDQYRYDTALDGQKAATAWSFPSVERQAAGNGLQATTAAVAEQGDAPHKVAVRHETYAFLRTTIDQVDNVGNVLRQTEWGRGGRGEFGEVVADEKIVRLTTPMRVNDQACGGGEWMWRTSQTTTLGVAASDRLGTMVHLYDACGDLRSSTQGGSVSAVVGGFLYDTIGSTTVWNSTNVVVSYLRDPWGQVRTHCGGMDVTLDNGTLNCMRLSNLTYDPSYGQYPVLESIGAERAQGANGGRYLNTTAVWDRGLGVVQSALDPNGAESRALYDGLGRLTALYGPTVRGCENAQTPSVRIAYQLPGAGSASPLSRITTTKLVECNGYNHPDSQQITHAYVDGLGRARAKLDEGDPNSDAWEYQAPHAWIISGRTLLTAKGQVYRAFEPSTYDGEPANYASVLGAVAGAQVDTRYDAFSRPVLEVNQDGSYRSRSYHALSNDLCDEVDNGFGPSAHIGTCSTERRDGHDRVIDQQQRQVTLDGVQENHRLFTYYRPDGAVLRLVRAKTGANVLRPESGYTGLDEYVERRFYNDPMGRRIGSEDPDTDDRTQTSPASVASRVWRYAYNAVNDLIAVRDPRGCGQNFFYDLAGRLVGEAYGGCAEAQATEAPSEQLPWGSVGYTFIIAATPLNARYYYDAYPAWATPLVGAGGAGTLGRATATADQAQREVFTYDPRGNVVEAAKQMALPRPAVTLPGSSGEPLGNAPYSSKPAFDQTSETAGTASAVVYDTAHTYVRTAAFDHGNRNTRVRLPADPGFTDGTAPVVEGRIAFHSAGAVRRAELGIDGAFQPVIDNVAYTHDGLPARVRFGDGAFTGRAATETRTLHDVRRRPVETLTLRAPAIDRPAGTLGAVSVVADQRLYWDGASNLYQIEDRRIPAEWPAGHKPYHQTIYHDALYRVARVDYAYATNDLHDQAQRWREELARRAPHDAMRTTAAPTVANDGTTAVPNRVMSLTYSHDWLANMTDWSDDAHVFYERSLGQVANGHALSGSSQLPAYRPSALYLASNLDQSTPADLGGWLETDYGKGGNLLAMTVHARCTHASANSCRDPGGTNPTTRRNSLRSGCRCAREQHYVYRWDELNRLAEARRYDAENQAGWWLKARQRYRYDGGNQRTFKLNMALGAQVTLGDRAALDVFPGDFERRGLISSGTSWEPAADGLTETQYLVAGARVVWKDHDAPAPGIDRQHRITYAVSNLIGSTSAVIDLVSGELVEAGGFYPNGAREELLGADEALNGEEVPVEPAGFTGKEADEEVGVTYFGQRYLVSRIGRWATPDPMSIHAVGGGEAINAYHYVSGNILQARDPLGLQATFTTQASGQTTMPTQAKLESVPTTHEFVNGVDAPRDFSDLSPDHAAKQLASKQGWTWGARVELKGGEVVSAEYVVKKGDNAGWENWNPIGEGVSGGANNDAHDQLELLIGVASLARGALRIAAAKAIDKFAARRLASSAGAGEWASTGVAKYDQLMHGTKQLEKWRAGLNKYGVKLEVMPESSRTAGLAAQYSADGKTLFYDPTRFTYIALLHESRHAAQIVKNGMSGMSSLTSKWVRFFEQGAYNYEARVGKSVGFSREYMSQVQEAGAVSSGLQKTFEMSSKFRDAWR